MLFVYFICALSTCSLITFNFLPSFFNFTLFLCLIYEFIYILFMSLFMSYFIVCLCLIYEFIYVLFYSLFMSYFMSCPYLNFCYINIIYFCNIFSYSISTYYFLVQVLRLSTISDLYYFDIL